MQSYGARLLGNTFLNFVSNFSLEGGNFQTKKSARSKNTQNGQETAWVGVECQIMLGKIVGSEKKVVVPKLQKVEAFGQ